jgi:hypothetical protein
VTVRDIALVAFLFLINFIVFWIGYDVGAASERRRIYRVRERYVPMGAKWRQGTEPLPWASPFAREGCAPKLPDLSKWKRGGRW